MQRSRRSCFKRLDYKLLHTIGEKMEKTDLIDSVIPTAEKELTMSDIVDDSKSSVAMQLGIDEATLNEDIRDFLEENLIEDMEHSMQDLDAALVRVEEFRSEYRRKHNHLQRFLGEMYDEQYKTSCLEMMERIKTYILEAKKCRKIIRDGETKKKDYEMIGKQKSFKFLLDEVDRTIEDFEDTFKLSKELTNDDVTRLKKDVSHISKELVHLSGRFLELHQLADSGDNLTAVEKRRKRYEKLIITKEKYFDDLQKEATKRELEKHKKFNDKSLNVKLAKFKGYGSSIDVYTFQSDFEKVHLRDTPTELLPDVLKNNFLENPALALVRHLDDINEIWERLKSAYGDPRMMMNKRMTEIGSLEGQLRSRDPEKITDGLCKIISIMKDLEKLCKRHKIEQRLYNGDGMQKIYKSVGEARITRWISKNSDKDMNEEESWKSLLEFLEMEMKIVQKKQQLFGKNELSQDKDPKQNSKGQNNHYQADGLGSNTDLMCRICGELGHVATMGPGQSKLIQYFTCRKFVEMTPGQRFAELKKKGLCIQCLFPGAASNSGKHIDGNCQRDFICRHPSHSKHPRKKHVLVCEEHKDDDENKKVLEEYKKRCILCRKVELPSYSKDIKLSFHSDSPEIDVEESAYGTKSVTDNAIYQLQTIQINGKRFNLFYDSGCGDFVSKYSAVLCLGNRARQEHPGPIQLGGVGGLCTTAQHGAYTVRLPTHDGDDVELTGVCLDRITSSFPEYPIQGKVEDDIRAAFIKEGGNPDDLPRLPKYSAGGEVDFMIGIKYLRYHPEKVFQLPSGLTIYRSSFLNADGGRGVIGGPHEVFSAIDNHFQMNQDHMNTFLCNQREMYRYGYQINPDISLLGLKEPDGAADGSVDFNHFSGSNYAPRCEKIFNMVENCGSEISYRCINCRNCKTCKDHDQIENISIREEVEEDLIQKCINVDVNERTSTAVLPFIHDPVMKLAPNRSKALKVYNQQLKKLSSSAEDKEEVLKSEAKLQKLGFVDYIKNLSPEVQDALRKNPIQNYIPWRVVWKHSSISTPCRVVFDASMTTDSGFSLNDTLAKGSNTMNKLQEIMIRWSMHKIGLHTDIQKMYNCVKLKESDWCYQRYLWQENLDVGKDPEEKVILTLIYGVKPSGNLAERCIRVTAMLSKTEYPHIYELIILDIYVDDCISGGRSPKEAAIIADQLEIVLNRGGFSLKGVAFSKKKPPESLSEDGESVVVAGIRWYTEDDEITLNVGELNFVKKKRGRKVGEVGKIPEKLTRRMCVAKVAEVYDILGKITPITAGMKLDLHELVQLKLNWDDVIPDNLRSIWISNFEMMKEINGLRYKRAIVPDDAANLEISTLDFGDASRSVACAAIYARFLRTNGEYSCQLVLSRSKLIPEGMTMPRSELYAAVLNSHTGEVVRRAFHKYHVGRQKFTDSQITLYWLNNEEKPLKQWVRNRVVEVRRFSDLADWSYVESRNMIADKGTRKGCTLEDVNQDSTWINGFDWMKKDKSMFPVKSVEDIKLDQTQMQEFKKEMMFHDNGASDILKMSFNCEIITRKIPDQVVKRYEFSRYIIDPNRRRFKTVVRIVGWLYRFIHNLKSKVKKIPVEDWIGRSTLSMDEIQNAERYFFRAATEEVKHFMKEKQYGKISKEQNGILTFTGRILPSGGVSAVTPMTDAMKDLSATTFCVPVIERHSPIAYSIINDIHWYDDTVKHSGNESVWRYVLKYAYIVEGKEIVKIVKKSCQRCRYLAKRTIEVAMGPISRYNMMIAPIFYITQVDLAGPFKAYSSHNKRSTLKIWLAVFVCATTSCTSIKILDDYSTTAFIQAFIRLSCEVGYPKMLLTDAGSQIVKGSETMQLKFTDVKNKLHEENGIEFEVCPVGGHNVNGKVERKIREIKASLEKNVHNERLSLIQWETVTAIIANCINNLPLAIGNETTGFESMDLITPNRLRLGRNNERNPIDSMCITNDPMKIIGENERIFNTWFENWLLSHVPKLVNQPKWFKTEDIQVGDIVLFTKHESIVDSNYQYGIVKSVIVGDDGLIRKASVRYRNHNESIDRETYRSVRTLVVIHKVNELDILQELAEIANIADCKFAKNEFSTENVS